MTVLHWLNKRWGEVREVSRSMRQIERMTSTVWHWGGENRDQWKENVSVSTWSTLFPLPLIPINLSFVSGLTQPFFKFYHFTLKPLLLLLFLRLACFFFYLSVPQNVFISLCWTLSSHEQHFKPKITPLLNRNLRRLIFSNMLFTLVFVLQRKYC